MFTPPTQLPLEGVVVCLTQAGELAVLLEVEAHEDEDGDILAHSGQFTCRASPLETASSAQLVVPLALMLAGDFQLDNSSSLPAALPPDPVNEEATDSGGPFILAPSAPLPLLLVRTDDFSTLPPICLG